MLSPLRKVRIFVFNCSYPLPPEGGTIENQQVLKSPSGVPDSNRDRGNKGFSEWTQCFLFNL
jgi:hypothetical protein